MEDNKLERIKMIAEKPFSYNRDMNLHIESCRISMEIIKKKESTINILKSMLEERDEKIRKLEENNLTESTELREVITEQYRFIGDLLKNN